MALNELKRTIGPYQVLDVIGHGGMATVYQAWEPELERVVAIKVLLPAFVDDAAFRFRFAREARLVARLRHPHIVGVYSFGEDEAVPYLVMEYLQGHTLQAELKRRRQSRAPYSPAQALELLRPLASALDYAHTRDVIHRDLKPDNIILTAGGPVITDFGLAKLLQEEAATVSVVMGTPSYMSPEQIQAQPVDQRTDVYALGILLYELLTSKVPFTGPSPVAVAQAHLSQVPPSLAGLNAGSSSMPLLDEVARRAIAKRKGDRWPSAGAMIGALERAVEGSCSTTGKITLPSSAPALAEGVRPTPPPLATPPRLQRPPASAGKTGRLVLLLPLLALAGGALWGATVWAPRPADPLERPVAILTTVATPAPIAPTSRPGGVPDVAPTPQPTLAAPPNAAVNPGRGVQALVQAPLGANIRGGPGMTYPPVTSLDKGVRLTVLGRSGGWVEVEADTGARGWIATSLVAIVAGEIDALPAAVAPPLPTLAAVAPRPTRGENPGPAPAPASTAAPASVDEVAIRMEDTAFGGGYRNRGASVYGGRTATWVYGQSSGHSQMAATFSLAAPGMGTASLTIEGMDSEDAAKTPIRIAINGVTLFEGASPFPNDDIPLQSGRWSPASFFFDASLLAAGSNTITITNLAGGGVGLPPFVALDYAVVRLP